METRIQKPNQPKVLLIEDELIVQKVHGAMLDKLGCQVDLAETGEQALAKFVNHYDIIFMDVGLPDISGTQVTAEMRARETGNKRVPIVVLTGYAQEEIKNQCLAVGADAVFTKPTNFALLEKILHDYVQYKSQQ